MPLSSCSEGHIALQMSKLSSVSTKEYAVPSLFKIGYVVPEKNSIWLKGYDLWIKEFTDDVQMMIKETHKLSAQVRW